MSTVCEFCGKPVELDGQPYHKECKDADDALDIMMEAQGEARREEHDELERREV